MRARTINRLLPLVFVGALAPAHAAMVITEVAPWSSGNSSVGADWFELTNTGTEAVSLTGWRMDDSSNAFDLGVALRGLASVAPGQSVIFFEGNTSGSNDAAIADNFRALWGNSFVFGTNLGSYGGGGVGLSTGPGDAVSIFDASGAPQAFVSFLLSPTPPQLPTFDNTALLNNTTLSTLSAVGINGAVSHVNGMGSTEIGSPGVAISAVPLPASAWLLVSGGAFLLRMRRRADSRRET